MLGESKSVDSDRMILCWTKSARIHGMVICWIGPVSGRWMRVSDVPRLRGLRGEIGGAIQARASEGGPAKTPPALHRGTVISSRISRHSSMARPL